MSSNHNTQAINDYFSHPPEVDAAIRRVLVIIRLLSHQPRKPQDLHRLVRDFYGHDVPTQTLQRDLASLEWTGIVAMDGRDCWELCKEDHWPFGNAV